MAKAKHELTSQEAFVAACRAGKLSAIEQAMQGADLDGAARVVGSFPMTPLAAAAISGNPKVVEFRLARGASYKEGWRTAENATATTLPVLAAHGALDQTNDDGYTPLHMALRCNSAAQAKRMLKLD